MFDPADLSDLPRRLALLLIRAYQRGISPHKRFGCAYRLRTGCASCSQLGARAIRRHGVLAGLALLEQRLSRCGQAHSLNVAARAADGPHLPVLASAATRRQRALHPQAGACDLPCDAPGDVCDGDCTRKGCNGLSACLDCSSCDCRGWRRNDPMPKRRKAGREAKWTYVPPGNRPDRQAPRRARTSGSPPG